MNLIFRSYIILSVFVCLMSFEAYSQELATGFVEYGVFPTKNIKAEDSDIQQLFSATEKEMKNVRMLLYFNQDKSLFIPNSNLQIGEGSYFYEMALAMAGAKNKTWYSSITDNEVIMKYNFMGKNYLISSKPNEINIDLKQEKKIIHSYVAHKAICTKTILGSKGAKKVDYEVWYVPDLNVPFGPLGLLGLPGLILEVNFSNISIRAIEIAKEPTNFKIERPKDGSEIQSNSFFDMASKMVENYRDARMN